MGTAPSARTDESSRQRPESKSAAEECLRIDLRAPDKDHGANLNRWAPRESTRLSAASYRRSVLTEGKRCPG